MVTLETLSSCLWFLFLFLLKPSVHFFIYLLFKNTSQTESKCNSLCFFVFVKRRIEKEPCTILTDLGVQTWQVTKLSIMIVSIHILLQNFIYLNVTALLSRVNVNVISWQDVNKKQITVELSPKIITLLITNANSTVWKPHSFSSHFCWLCPLSLSCLLADISVSCWRVELQ